ncbi:hypothetical protein [Candidatus Xenohaliotis californiensis]
MTPPSSAGMNIAQSANSMAATVSQLQQSGRQNSGTEDPNILQRIPPGSAILQIFKLELFNVICGNINAAASLLELIGLDKPAILTILERPELSPFSTLKIFKNLIYAREQLFNLENSDTPIDDSNNDDNAPNAQASQNPDLFSTQTSPMHHANDSELGGLSPSMPQQPSQNMEDDLLFNKHKHHRH